MKIGIIGKLPNREVIKEIQDNSSLSKMVKRLSNAYKDIRKDWENYRT